MRDIIVTFRSVALENVTEEQVGDGHLNKYIALRQAKDTTPLASLAFHVEAQLDHL